MSDMFDTWEFYDLESELVGNFNRHKWQDINGKWHLISEMDTSYINNCIRMINKRNSRGMNWRNKYMDVFKKELKSRDANTQGFEL